MTAALSSSKGKNKETRHHHPLRYKRLKQAAQASSIGDDDDDDDHDDEDDDDDDDDDDDVEALRQHIARPQVLSLADNLADKYSANIALR